MASLLGISIPPKISGIDVTFSTVFGFFSYFKIQVAEFHLEPFGLKL